jgi:hypothetical protein
MVGVYFALFWIQCVAGIAISVYNQIWLRSDITITDTMLQIIVGTGPISLGAAANSILIAISAEGIMVLAAWVKKRQLEQGIQIGRAEERKRANAKMRALAKEYGIPEEKLQIEDETE